jgi:hypothetical protein
LLRAEAALHQREQALQQRELQHVHAHQASVSETHTQTSPSREEGLSQREQQVAGAEQLLVELRDELLQLQAAATLQCVRLPSVTPAALPCSGTHVCRTQAARRSNPRAKT